MKYINPNSKRGLVNKFADFIIYELTKNTPYTSKIEVSLYEAFFVINGCTLSEIVLDMTDIQNRFYEKNKSLFELLNIKNINSIDIIKYGTKPSIPSEQYFEFFNSDKPTFNEKLIKYVNDNNLDYLSVNYTDKIELEIISDDSYEGDEFVNYSCDVISSEFPYGYSLNTNRSHLYYSEYISNQLFNVALCEKIMFKFSNKINSETDDLRIGIDSDSHYFNGTLESLVLDVFDFNMDNFIKNKLQNFDFNTSVDEQLNSSSWLEKDKLREMIIF